jgi:hypothetical protein
MRLPPGRRAFAVTTLSKFHFSHSLPPNLRRSFVVLFAFWQNVIDPPRIVASRQSLFQHKCSYHRFHFHPLMRGICIIALFFFSLTFLYQSPFFFLFLLR